MKRFALFLFLIFLSTTCFAAKGGKLRIAVLPAPFGELGVPYYSCAEVTGGVPPYTWSIDDGMLPPGIILHALSGCLDGTPTVEGSFNYVLRVTDNSWL